VTRAPFIILKISRIILIYLNYFMPYLFISYILFLTQLNTIQEFFEIRLKLHFDAPSKIFMWSL